ncbi:hypothetical protein ABZ501_27135 [Streptomyces sp. NPDC019922]|uniref:hypothetical protein n=1 Tax=Streptomyces TaxID=1883 RepID=UPI001371C5BB|nr:MULTISPECIES: hypothetical protein [unclassified Streptomyces]MDX2620153.1 hypothetical protein [Streptomyces sp. WI03-5b]MYT60451.1 hypothetical protein [Streptomyces sp. SID7834]
MRVLKSFQQEEISDAVMAKFAMVAPVFEAILYSVAMDRVARLGGYENWTLHDLAREFREGDGDAGICFELAVHEAIGNRNNLIWQLASEVLHGFCGIPGGASSILFGPEKEGRIPVLETVQNSLTDESLIYVGSRGRPPKLKRHIPEIFRAFHRADARESLPRSINGLWKADLFVGNPQVDKWVGTTVKVKPAALEGAEGLRIGIYPKSNNRDVPRKDERLNLIRLPLPYDSAFMELFYKSFFLVRAFLRSDATTPPRVELPDAEDRYIVKELEARRDFPLMEVLDAIRRMSQYSLLDSAPIATLAPTASLSERDGLDDADWREPESESVSLSPAPLSE